MYNLYIDYNGQPCSCVIFSTLFTKSSNEIISSSASVWAENLRVQPRRKSNFLCMNLVNLVNI